LVRLAVRRRKPDGQLDSSESWFVFALRRQHACGETRISRPQSAAVSDDPRYLRFAAKTSGSTPRGVLGARLLRGNLVVVRRHVEQFVGPVLFDPLVRPAAGAGVSRPGPVVAARSALSSRFVDSDGVGSAS